MSMSRAVPQPRLANSAIAGALAGLAGGIVFGMLMGIMGMLPIVGMLVRQESAGVGFLVHMLISAFIGAVYGVVAARLSRPAEPLPGRAPFRRPKRVVRSGGQTASSTIRGGQ